MSMPPTHAQAAELGVSYTLKELFERVDGKLDGIDNKLDSKADQKDLDELARQVTEIALWRARTLGFAAAVGAIVGSGAFGVLRLFA